MSQDGREPDAAPPDDIEDADPALARERTDLAWTRSAISFFAVGVAIGKFRPAIGIPVLALGGVVWLVGHGWPARDQAGIASRRVLVVAVAVTCLALIAVVLALTGQSAPGLRP